jgi:hypothetical protein
MKGTTPAPNLYKLPADKVSFPEHKPALKLSEKRFFEVQNML